MVHPRSLTKIICHLLFPIILIFSPLSFADKWKSSHKSNHPARNGDYAYDPYQDQYRILGFSSRERALISDYYSTRVRSSRCPPGLAKKGTGCLPPGQAKKWTIYQNLPRDVDLYPLPRQLLRGLPPPPRGYRYVRVANDILMIAVGSAMVADAIEDIVR